MGTTVNTDTGAWECDLCDAVMIESNCKLKCENCGFVRDCSDP